MTITHSSIFTFLKCILLTVPCLSEATGWRCWVRAALIRDRAPMVAEDPIESAPFIRGPSNRWCRGPYWICSVYYYYYYYYSSSSSKLNRILEDLNMLEKSGNFAHASERWKFTSDMGFRSRCGKMARQAPPINIQRSAPRATFHVHLRKLVHSCNITIPTKKSLGTKSETKQEVGYFEFSCHILVSFLPFSGVIL